MAFSEKSTFIMTDSFVAIQAAKRSIVDDQPKEFTKWLRLLPLNELSKEAGDKLLTIFLFQIWEHERMSCLLPLLTAWERIYPRDEKVPMYVMFFTIDSLPWEILKMIIRYQPGATFLETINWLMTYHNSEIMNACQKVWQVFGSQNYNTLKTLQEVADSEENSVIYNFLTNKIREISPYAPIPSWVRDFRIDVSQEERESEKIIEISDEITEDDLTNVDSQIIKEEINLENNEEQLNEVLTKEKQMKEATNADEADETITGNRPSIFKSIGQKAILSKSLDNPGKAIIQPDSIDYGQPISYLIDNIDEGRLLPSFEETLYIPEEPVVKLPSTDKIVEIMMKGLKQSQPTISGSIDKRAGKESTQEIESRLYSELAAMIFEEKMDLVRPNLIIQAGQIRMEDPFLHRLYGPANPNISPTPEEMLYGGERMFLSVEFDEDLDFEGVVTDWFLGYCIECNLRIRRRWHAVRAPNESGGWTGCYCSWKCVRQNIHKPDSFDGEVNPSLIQLGLVDKISREMIKFGVQDRRDNGDIFFLE